MVKKWEYEVGIDEKGFSIEEELHYLNVMGNHGWELCSIIPEGSSYYWKRELSQSSVDIEETGK